MHWLSRLLAPESVAVIGASNKSTSVGNKTLCHLRDGGYAGSIYPVNPRYQEVAGYRCFASISELPEVPDLVVFAVSGTVLENTFEQAIMAGVGGIVIYANNYIPGDIDPPLLERLITRAKAANIPVCGGNCMGFYNRENNVMVSFDLPPQRPLGNIFFVAHSGSAFTYFANNDARHTTNIALSVGQEINATFVDYADYALSLNSTRVIALFVETVRDPPGFVALLKKAYQKVVPVVVVKVGRTEKSAQFAASHSGAIAGSYDAFKAVCEHYGAICVRDIDELAVTSLLLSTNRRPAKGGLGALFDSGGLREQFMDLASELNLPFAQISESTRERLKACLEFGLAPENPVDAMGSFNADFVTVFRECMHALLDDPDSALLSFEFELRDDYSPYPVLLEVVQEMLAYSTKPVIVVNSFTRTTNENRAAELIKLGIPVINGAELALRGIRNVLWYRDHRQSISTRPEPPPASVVSKWSAYLCGAGEFDESTTLKMVADFGLPVTSTSVVNNERVALDAAREFGFPLVLKTAELHIKHKTEVGGVKLPVNDMEQVKQSYLDLAARIGPRVLVAPMITGGVELAFGMVNDAQFGPIIIVGAGGANIEMSDDRIFSLPSFDQTYAKQLIHRLNIHKILQGTRGHPGYDIEAVAEALSKFSLLVSAIGMKMSEMDLNPIIVKSKGCVVVDGLVERKK